VVRGRRFGKLGHLSPVVCGWRRLDFGVRYNLCPPGKRTLGVYEILVSFTLNSSFIFLSPSLSEARLERRMAGFQVGLFDWGSRDDRVRHGMLNFSSLMMIHRSAPFISGPSSRTISYKIAVLQTVLLRLLF